MNFIKLTTPGDDEKLIVINTDHIVRMQVDADYNTRMFLSHGPWFLVTENLPDILAMLQPATAAAPGVPLRPEQRRVIATALHQLAYAVTHNHQLDDTAANLALQNPVLFEAHDLRALADNIFKDRS